MQIDSYSLGRNCALFLKAGSPIPPEFAERNSKPVKRNAYFDDPVLIANIEKQGWHARKVEVCFTVRGIGTPPR